MGFYNSSVVNLKQLKLQSIDICFLSEEFLHIFFKITGSNLLLTYYSSKSNLFRLMFLHKSINFCKGPYIVDAAQFSNTLKTSTLVYTLNCMLDDKVFNINIDINRDLYIVSTLTTLYKSSIWLERELSEFTGLVFSGSLDSRRLLMDYTDCKGSTTIQNLDLKIFSNSWYEVINGDIVT